MHLNRKGLFVLVASLTPLCCQILPLSPCSLNENCCSQKVLSDVLVISSGWTQERKSMFSPYFRPGTSLRFRKHFASSSTRAVTQRQSLAYTLNHHQGCADLCSFRVRYQYFSLDLSRCRYQSDISRLWMEHISIK